MSIYAFTLYTIHVRHVYWKVDVLVYSRRVVKDMKTWPTFMQADIEVLNTSEYYYNVILQKKKKVIQFFAIYTYCLSCTMIFVYAKARQEF